MHIGMLLDMAADGFGDRVVVGSRTSGLTAAVVRNHVGELAARLEAHGATSLAFADTNRIALPIALFAAAYAKVPFAPLSYRTTDAQLDAILAELPGAAVVTSADTRARFSDLGGRVVLDSAADIEARAELAKFADALTDDIDPESVAVMLFTSGTSGPPKVALLRHRHLASYVLSTVEFMGASEDEAQLVSVPPYHIAGISSILSSVFSGRRIVYLPAFDPEEWVQTVRHESITHAMVVPTMLRRILGVLGEPDGPTQQSHRKNPLPSLQHLSYGGGRMPLDVISEAMRQLPNVDFVNAYGLTETSSTIAILGPDDHRVAFASPTAKEQRRLGSVGRPLPTVEVEIRDPEGGVVATGDSGEIFVRGEQVAGEYRGRRALTSDGWFPTNDAGHFDADGYLFLDGRLDDVVVRGGENLSPGEIEDVLLAHPGVADAAVVGIPDTEWGETVAAVVVRAPELRVSADELKQWVRDRLRSARTPTIVEFRDSLPYNETGKLLRRVLRADLTATPRTHA